MALNHNILLESGTNEFEIVEFTLKGKIDYRFCINVAKVREVILFPEIIHVPESHDSIVGTANLRKKLVPIIDLAYWLGIRGKSLNEKSKVIITYFNGALNGFVVDEVVGIHRITWSEIKDYAAISDFKLVDAVLGVVKLKGNLVQLLDFERILSDINPTTMTSKDAAIDMELKPKRLGKRVYLAEDSPVIRKVLVNNFTRAGYDIKAFDNGASLLMEFKKLVPDVVVTDLEMPGTSGDYVVKKIRERPEFNDLPIIVFSSMASEENERKLKAIGANMLIGKPELDFLIHKVDEVALS